MNKIEREIYDKYAYNKTHVFLVYEEFERRANNTNEEYEGLKTGECRFDYSSWEKRLNISHKVLINTIKLLVKESYIEQRLKGKKGMQSIYFLTRFSEQKEEQKKINSIFEYWNSKGIVKHRALTKEIEKAIIKTLKEYTEEEIKVCIDNYNEILKDQDYYFNYIWTLKDFLIRKTGINTFRIDGAKMINYKKEKLIKGEKLNEHTKQYKSKNRGCFNEGAGEIEYKPRKTEHRTYSDEELKDFGIL
ncbi:hypothetical protein [Clostridium perfringens]|uniref:hypothetical protein n=1 Tax=Clostridium perfringens TaxID=1502 RepID=UPI0039EC485A